MNNKQTPFFKEKVGFYGKSQGIVIFLLVLILFANSFYLGFRYYEISTLKSDDKNLHIQKIAVIKKLLEENYLFSDKVSPDKMFDGAIDGMVYSMGDPYTRYVSYRDYENFKIETEGRFGGIGVTVDTSNSEKGIKIVSTMDGQGAQLAGIKPDDTITAVDGKPISGMAVEDAVALIRGEIGTNVKLTIERDGELMEVLVERKSVELPAIQHYMLENNIGVIRYNNFTRVSVEQFDKAYKELKEKGLKYLILDLRNNTGGLVESSVEIASRFMEENKKVVEIENKKYATTINSVKTEYKVDVPTIVLVNENTASASEILTAALKDYKLATVIGTQTYGKGLVQETIPIDDKSAIIVTVSQYLTPNGENIQANGIKPDIEVEISSEDLLKGIDTQLNKAIEYIKSLNGDKK